MRVPDICQNCDVKRLQLQCFAKVLQSFGVYTLLEADDPQQMKRLKMSWVLCDDLAAKAFGPRRLTPLKGLHR